MAVLAHICHRPRACVQVVAAFHGVLTASLVAELQSKAKRVFAWTVDNAGDMWRILDLGVDGVVTNQAMKLQEAIKGHDCKCTSPGLALE